MNNGSLDFFQFTLSTASRVLIQSALPFAGALGSIPDGRIYDSSGQLVHTMTAQDGKRGVLGLLDVYLGAGTWYFYVDATLGYSNPTGAFTKPYAFDIRCDPGGSAIPHVGESVEPNGPLGVGTPSPMPLHGTISGSLSNQFDRDWWEITTTSQTALLVYKIPLPPSTAAVTDLALFDAAGVEVISPLGWTTPALWTTLPAGTHYLQVGLGGIPTVGNYRLAIESRDASFAALESPEPNDNPFYGSSPSTLSPGMLGLGTCDPATPSQSSIHDVDWWEFTVAEDCFITVETWGGLLQPGQGGVRDHATYMWTTNPGTGAPAIELPRLAGGFWGGHARDHYWVPAGTHWVSVQDFLVHNNGPQTYLIRLTKNDTSAYHTLMGGCQGSNGLAPEWRVRDFEWPMLGTTFVGEFRNCPGGAFLLTMFGFDNKITSTGVALPVDLGIVGAPGCIVAVDPLVTGLLASTAAGEATWWFNIPLSQSIAGTFIHQQALVLDPAANALGLTATNAGVGLITGAN